MANQTTARNLRSFFIIWIGQLVSLVGSQLTAFVLGVWVYDEIRSVLWLAVTQIAFSTPQVLFSPPAGVLADRWNRGTVMIVSDVGAGMAVLAAGMLYLTHQLQPWMVIPREQYGRANGFVQLGDAITQIAGPALAGVLYVTICLGNMALIDFVTYLFAATLMILFVRIPNPPRTDQDQQTKKSVRCAWLRHDDNLRSIFFQSSHS